MTQAARSSELFLTLPRQDMAHILAHAEWVFRELQNANVLITGGTGFFGRWMAESLLYANEHLGLNAKALILTRRPDAFREAVPALAHHSAVLVCEGDVCQPDSLTFSVPATHILHLATDTVQSRQGELQPEAVLASLDTIVAGTRHILELARQQGVKRTLVTSSGAIYGKQPPELSHVPESYPGAPNPTEVPGSLYGEGKRMAELLCSLYAKTYQLPVSIARCFAFVGPLLPLDGPYAIGNFIRDARQGSPLSIRGDGTPVRSYLYAADLAVWLWTLLQKGQPGEAYNVGSAQAVSIFETAQAVSRCMNPMLPVQVGQPPQRDKLPERYVPSVQKAEVSLGLVARIDLEEGIHRTLNWLDTATDVKTDLFPMTQTR